MQSRYLLEWWGWVRKLLWGAAAYKGLGPFSSSHCMEKKHIFIGTHHNSAVYHMRTYLIHQNIVCCLLVIRCWWGPMLLRIIHPIARAKQLIIFPLPRISPNVQDASSMILICRLHMHPRIVRGQEFAI